MGRGLSAVFAYTYYVDLQEDGYEPELQPCVLADDVPPALVRVN